MTGMSIRQTPAPSRGTLVASLLLSVGVHALALMFYEQPDSPYAGTPTLSIVIEERRLTTTTSSPHFAPAQQRIETSQVHEPLIEETQLAKEVALPSPQKLASVTPEATPANRDASIADTTITEPVTVSNSRDIARQREVITLRLQQALARHFNYPLQARRRGWQGEVILAFTLERNGQILDIQIARGSGHRALDRAALASLNKVGRIEHASTQALSFELPVIYRLQEG